MLKLKLAVLGAALCASLGAYAQTTWHMATPYVDANYHTKNIREFAAEINKTTGGQLNIIVHSGQSLIKHTEIPRAVRTQQIPIGEVFIGIMGNTDPIFKLDNIPFLATNFEQAKKLYQASKATLEKQLDKQGMMLLYSVPWPPQGLYSKKAITSINDIKGAKMRSYSPTQSRLAALLGAQATTVQTVEIPQAFSTGIIEMMITSPTTGVNSQSWDYVSHYTDVQAWIPKNMVIVNKRAFRRLSKDVQQNILTAAKHAEERGWKLAQQETVTQTQTLKDNGMQVAKPTAGLMTALKAVGKTMAQEWAQSAGAEGAAVLKAYRQ